MALQLFKLASENFPKISATTSQAAHAYFHTMSVTVSIAANSAYSIVVSKWVKENGNAATAFATGQGSNSLCINGVLQQSGLYTIVGSSFVITPTSAMKLRKGYPITLETYNAKAAVVRSALVSSLVAIP